MNDQAIEQEIQSKGLTCYCHDDTIDRTIYHWGLQIGDETYTTYAQFAAACGAGSELERVLMRGSM